MAMVFFEVKPSIVYGGEIRNIKFYPPSTYAGNSAYKYHFGITWQKVGGGNGSAYLTSGTNINAGAYSNPSTQYTLSSLIIPDMANASGGLNASNLFIEVRLVSNDSYVMSYQSFSVDGDGTSYWFTANPNPSTLPAAPVLNALPASINDNNNITVSWEAANLAAQYRLQRKIDAGSWTTLYTGASRTYTDSEVKTLWNSVQYRVYGINTYGNSGAYSTSSVITITHNTPPIISGSDNDLGAFAMNKPAPTYTISDAQGGAVTVIEKIDNTLIRSYTVTLGNTNTFTIPVNTWFTVLNGSHTLSITATDSSGATSVRTYTFSKNVTEIIFTLTTPLLADALITKTIVSVIKSIPAGATFKIELCNNGFDASPTWEDATIFILTGAKFFFTNTVKTAAEWGYNLKVTIKRLTGSGACNISSIGGNFE
jgi:hypothetical protein